MIGVKFSASPFKREFLQIIPFKRRRITCREIGHANAFLRICTHDLRAELQVFARIKTRALITVHYCQREAFVQRNV